MVKNLSDFSVVIRAKNEERWIGYAIQSVLDYLVKPEIVVVDNNLLKFYNRFDFITKEDFIYYLLFTAEQLKLNPEEFPLVLIGAINERDDLYQIAYKYIRNVSLLQSKSMLHSKDSSSNHFTLLNSL